MATLLDYGTGQSLLRLLRLRLVAMAIAKVGTAILVVYAVLEGTGALALYEARPDFNTLKHFVLGKFTPRRARWQLAPDREENLMIFGTEWNDGSITLTIWNRNDQNVKDIEVRCSLRAESGDIIRSGEGTIHATFPARSTVTADPVPMKFGVDESPGAASPKDLSPDDCKVLRVQ